MLTVGTLLELVSLASLVYILSLIPAVDLKGMLFLLTPAVGMLYGVFIIWLGARLKAR